MSTEYILGFIVGIVVVLGIVALLILFYKKNNQAKRKYDERQLVTQGKGYKYGFFTLLIYCFIYGLSDVALENRWCDTFTGIVIGVCLALVVFAGYCIWNDAYFAINEKPASMILIFIIIGGMNTLLGIMRVVEGKLLENGILSYRSTNLFMGITFLLIGLVFLAKTVKNRKEEE